MNNTLRVATLGLLSAALLSACSSTPAAPEKAAPTTAIDGTLTGASNTTVSAYQGDKVLSSASVDGNGHFVLSVPSDTKMNDYKVSLSTDLLASIGCTGNLTLSDAAAKGSGIIMLKANNTDYMNAVVTKSGLLGRIRELTGTGYVYADRATTATGTLDCSKLTSMPTPITVNLNLNQGWNFVSYLIRGEGGLGGITVNGSVDNSNPQATSTWQTKDSLMQTMTTP